jgi:two-component system chemotaxis response regulator CheY
MKDKKSLVIVIIEDEDVSRLLLRHILTGDGYQIAGEAQDGASGLLMVKQLRPDVVCLDIMMPQSSGLDVLKRIKQILPWTVVLMVTGSNDRETVMAAAKNGADGYIIKPFNANKLLRTVEHTYAKSQERKMIASIPDSF